MIDLYTNQLLNFIQVTKEGSCNLSKILSLNLKLLFANWANTIKNVIIIVVVKVILPDWIFVIMMF